VKVPCSKRATPNSTALAAAYSSALHALTAAPSSCTSPDPDAVSAVRPASSLAKAARGCASGSLEPAASAGFAVVGLAGKLTDSSARLPAGDRAARDASRCRRLLNTGRGLPTGRGQFTPSWLSAGRAAGKCMRGAAIMAAGSGSGGGGTRRGLRPPGTRPPPRRRSARRASRRSWLDPGCTTGPACYSVTRR